MPSDNPIGQPFIHLDVVQSTNNYAMAQVQTQMAEHGTTWFANYQTLGKGQRGKVWQMEPGQNIILSIVFDPSPLQIAQQFQLSAVVSLACFDFFDAYSHGDTSIKWPNDLYWKDRKAGGILIENMIKGNEWKYAVVGIGININQTRFAADLRNPVSLKQITGKDYDAAALGKELCNSINNRWQQLLKTSFDTILHEYNQVLYKRNEKVDFKKDNIKFQAVPSGVNDLGQLTTEGNTGTFNHGEIEWILP